MYMTDKTETANMTQRKDIKTGQDRQDGQGRTDKKKPDKTARSEKPPRMKMDMEKGHNDRTRQTRWKWQKI